MGKKRGRPKSRYTLDKEAYEEFLKLTNEAFDKTELAGVKAHRSKGYDPEAKILLSGNLKNKKELKVLFDEFKRKGLIPEYITPKHAKGKKIYLKDPESLLAYVNERTRIAYLRGLFGKKIKGVDPANQYKIGILNEIIRREALSKIPKANRTPEILADIEKMSWKGLPLKIDDEGNVTFARRQFSDKVPQAVIEWGNKNLGNDTGTRWAKDARKGWEELRLENQRYKELTGFDFDRGHFYPSARGGPNTRRNASSELSFDFIGKTKTIAGNRDKGNLANWKGTNVGRELGTSNSWMQDLIEFHLDETGQNVNQLPKDYLIDNPGHASIQQRQTLIGQKHAAQAAIAEKYNKYVEDLQPIPEGKLQTDLEIVDGQVVKKPKQTVIQQILGFKKKTNKYSGLSDIFANTPENYEVNYTPRNPNGNGVNGNGINGKNGNGIAVNGKNGKNGFLKGMENVKNYSGLGKLRDADQLANIGLNIGTGNYVGAGIGVATYGTAKALQDPRVQARVAKQITQLVAERGAKSAAKLIPGLDILLSSKESWDYLKRGRWDQAGIAALSGAIGWIPVVGDGISAALDLSNTGLDIARLQAPTGNNKKKGKNRLQRYLKNFYS